MYCCLMPACILHCLGSHKFFNSCLQFKVGDKHILSKMRAVEWITLRERERENHIFAVLSVGNHFNNEKWRKRRTGKDEDTLSLRRCLWITDLSTVVLEEGNITGSFIIVYCNIVVVIRNVSIREDKQKLAVVKLAFFSQHWKNTLFIFK